ncbi:MAG TPA: ribosome maturation factor RimM [candidate division Zixibacteria bacterium]|nr:ribosome maturation factor RimM [candidate division Zixibacteria bacterium]
MSSWRSSATKTERLAVARILGAKGLAGAMRVEPLSDVADRLEEGSLLFLEGEDEPRRVRLAELGGRVPVIGLEGISAREEVEVLIGTYLEVEAEELPEGTYYWHQLEGLSVTDEQGTRLGTLVEVFRAGGAEVYRVEGPRGELLLPALHEVVRRIDLAAGLMVVRPPETEDT